MSEDKMSGERFGELCKLLPEGVTWGDELTPHMLDEILQAALKSQSVSVPEVCSICNGSGYYCVGYSGSELDGNAPILENCDCEPLAPLPPETNSDGERLAWMIKHSAKIYRDVKNKLYWLSYMDSESQVRGTSLYVTAYEAIDQAMKEANTLEGEQQDGL